MLPVCWNRADAVIDPWLASLWDGVSALYPAMSTMTPLPADQP